MKYLLPIMMFLVTGCQRSDNIDSNKAPVEKQWIEIQSRLKNDKSNYNYGWIAKSDWDKIIQKGELPQFLYVNDVHWYSDDGVVLMESSSRTGQYFRFTTGIEFIYPIKSEDIEKLRLEEKAAEEKREQREKEKSTSKDVKDATKL